LRGNASIWKPGRAKRSLETVRAGESGRGQPGREQFLGHDRQVKFARPLPGVIGMQGFALRDGSPEGRTRVRLELAQASAELLLRQSSTMCSISRNQSGKLADRAG
jgi:hypothetical protein